MEIITDTVENGRRRIVARYTQQEKEEMLSRRETARREREARKNTDNGSDAK